MTKKPSNIVDLKEVYQKKLIERRAKLTTLNLKNKKEATFAKEEHSKQILVQNKNTESQKEDLPIKKSTSDEPSNNNFQAKNGFFESEINTNFEIDLKPSSDTKYDLEFNLDLDLNKSSSEVNIKDSDTDSFVPIRTFKTIQQSDLIKSNNIINLKLDNEIINDEKNVFFNFIDNIKSDFFSIKNKLSNKKETVSFIPLEDKYNFEPKDIGNPKEYHFKFGEFISYTKNLFFLKPELRKLYLPFVSIAMIINIIFPSFQLMYAGFTVKDNINLQITASKELFSRTNDNTDLYLTQNLLALSNGLDKTSNDINILQGNLSGMINVLPIISSVSAGEEVSKDLAKISSLSAELSIAIKPFLDDNFDLFDMNNATTTIESVKKTQFITKQIHEQLKSLNKNINRINTSVLPQSSVEEIVSTKKALPIIIDLTSDTDKYFDLLLKFIGDDRERNYLFIFQNNQELRPTGGFIGSYGLIKLDRGIIKKLDIKEIYSADGQLAKQILPPTPLKELSQRWFFRDSNWFADFSLSSEKMINFYEQSGGISTEGVISITPTIIERILAITGPITLEKYNTTISSENFIEMTQFQTVQENALEFNKPKQFLADLSPILLKKILSLEIPKLLEIYEVINQGIKERLIIANFKEDDLQDFVKSVNMSGELHDAPKDYLSVVNTNLGGYKTDGVIDNNIKVETKISDNGTITNKVTVKRTHNGGNEQYQWWNVPNINYLRLYVPNGSKIIGAKGFEERKPVELPAYTEEYDKDKDLQKIYDSEEFLDKFNITKSIESDKTVFGGWKTTATQQTSEVSIEYELPFKLKNRDLYSIIIQKQAGDIRSKYSHDITLDNNMKLLWNKTSNELVINKNKLSIKESLFNTDKFLALEIDRK